MAKFLRGHHLEDSGTVITCAGCGKKLAELTQLADKEKDGIYDCPNPHDEAEKGQLLRVG